MNRVIRCDCGFETVGDADEELVAGARAHALALHGADVPAEVLLSLIRPCPPTAPGRPE